MKTISDLHKILDKIAYGETYSDIFGHLLDSILYGIIIEDECNIKENPFDKIKDSQKQYLKDAMECLGDIMNDKGNLYDALGDLFMEHISYGRNGQYFTPHHLCDAMAKIQMDTIKDGSSVCDPTCGSGRMLLSAAKINRNVHLYGSDIDLTCIKMAVVNLALNNLVGEIVWGDPLSFKLYASFRIERHWNGFPTIRILKDSIHFPKIIEAKKEQSQLKLF